MTRALVSALLLIAALATAAPLGAAPVSEETVHEIGAQLRCVVCQSLSVADSPSETANQMRGIIRERLAAGDSPEQVKAYFVEKYGLWILLAPPRQGFNLLVWVVPFVALGDNEDEARALGAHAFVREPVHLDSLLRIIAHFSTLRVQPLI